MPPTIDIDDLGKYVPLGPNDIWHVGGHMKLEPFGIEISAAIDGYSRYVMWVYIGVSGRSAVSVERQYLDCITSLGYQPRTVHAAKGTETTLLESAHYEIRRFEDPTVDQPGDCFRYGRGMDNPRVEGWCSKLSMAVTSLMHVSSVDCHLYQLLLLKSMTSNGFYSLFKRSLVKLSLTDPI